MPPNDGRLLGQEGRDVPAEDRLDGLPHHLQRQRVAGVARHQRPPGRLVARQLTAGQQRADLRHLPARPGAGPAPPAASTRSGCSRLVSSRQPWCALLAQLRSTSP